jgi:ornithine cyclodeaminase/alanine dehydrogenase-like protein (mu-crystallin family)
MSGRAAMALIPELATRVHRVVADPGPGVMKKEPMTDADYRALTEALMDKVVMDDWGQAGAGPFGALRRHVDEGRLTRETLHAELGQIVAGLKPGHERPEERILLWHHGLSLSDIALGALALEKARRLGIGSRLHYA